MVISPVFFPGSIAFIPDFLQIFEFPSRSVQKGVSMLGSNNDFVVSPFNVCCGAIEILVSDLDHSLDDIGPHSRLEVKTFER